MRRLFHSVTLSHRRPTTLPPFHPSRARPVSLCATAAPSPIKPSTKLAARFPEEPTDSFSLARMNILLLFLFFFLPTFSNRHLFSLSLSSSRARGVLPRVFAAKATVEFYRARDCSRLNKTDRKIRSECVPHFRQSSRIFLISSRSFTRRAAQRVCAAVLFFFTFLFFYFSARRRCKNTHGEPFVRVIGHV